MKKHIILFAMSALLSAGAFAQEVTGKGNRNPAQRAERMAENISERLALEDDTKDKLAAIFSESFQEMKESRAESQQNMQKIARVRDERIKQLLTEEQYQEYGKLWAERKDKRDKKGRREGGRGHRSGQ